MMMDAPPPLAPEFTVEAFADPTTVKDVVKGILHTIFFHRFFPTLLPQTHEVLDLTLPRVVDAELETLIEARASAVARQLDAERRGAGTASGLRAQVVVAFLDKKRLGRRKIAASAGVGRDGGVGGGAAGGAVSGVATGSGAVGSGGGGLKSPRTWYQAAAGLGGLVGGVGIGRGGGGPGTGGQAENEEEVCWERWTVRVSIAEPRTEAERIKVRRAAEQTLQGSVMKVVSFVNLHRDHIPPITVSDSNPFPYQIILNPQQKDVTPTSAGWGVGRVFSGY